MLTKQKYTRVQSGI